jgi:uncharacterized RDD family membrane protein YckC
MTDQGAPGQNPVPGYYYAAGDPPGTVRQWDGTQWLGDPIPAPPGATGLVADNSSFATLGRRLGAVIIDILIVVVISVLGLVAFGDVDTTESSFNATGGAEQILVWLAITVVYIALIAVKGATPGKMMLGLAITTEDGSTTPVGAQKAVMRSLPYIIGVIPVLGFLVVLGSLIVSLVMISSDPERRSVFDRIGNTRVITK